jgi:hypothetical protein
MDSLKPEDSIQESNHEKSHEQLATEKSQSTAHGTIRKFEPSRDIEGPSVTVGNAASIEDSKFLLENSAQQSIMMPHMSKFTDNEEQEADPLRAYQVMQNIPETHSLYKES